MKKNIIILFCFFLLITITSCKLTKEKSVHYNNNNNLNNKIEFSDRDKIKYSFYEKENKIKVQNSEPLVGSAAGDYYHEDIRIVEVPNTKVFKQYGNLAEGRIVYKIPNVMKIRTTYKVLVRISKSKATVSIYDSLSGDVMTSRIPITETMEVKLIDVSPSDKKMFNIVEDDNEIQIVESGDTYTEWSWDVTPVHVGKTKLKIVVSIIKNNNKKDIVYEDTVEIERDLKEQLIFFWEEYWKWIITTFILPFVIWFWKNKKEKNKEDGKSETV